MGSTAASALFFLLLIAVSPAVFAKKFVVGDDAGWNRGVNYTKWVTGKTFRVGDKLEFRLKFAQTVGVIDKAGYDNCDSTRSTTTCCAGNQVIDLVTVGIKYFICALPGDCLAGMKLAVSVLPAASSPANPSAPSPESPPLSPKTPSPSASLTPNGARPVSKLLFRRGRGDRRTHNRGRRSVLCTSV